MRKAEGVARIWSIEEFLAHDHVIKVLIPDCETLSPVPRKRAAKERSGSATSQESGAVCASQKPRYTNSGGGTRR